MHVIYTQKKVHDYLGMTFDYTEAVVKVAMYNYLTGLLDGIPDKYLNGIGCITPASSNLYDVRHDNNIDKSPLPIQARLRNCTPLHPS